MAEISTWHTWLIELWNCTDTVHQSQTRGTRTNWPQPLHSGKTLKVGAQLTLVWKGQFFTLTYINMLLPFSFSFHGEIQPIIPIANWKITSKTCFFPQFLVVKSNFWWLNHAKSRINSCVFASSGARQQKVVTCSRDGSDGKAMVMGMTPKNGGVVVPRHLELGYIPHIMTYNWI